MQKIIKLPVLLMILFLLFSGTGMVQAQNTQSTSSVRSAIEETYEGFIKHIREGNAAAIAENYYTEDAKFFPPQGGEFTGQEPIENIFNEIINSGITLEMEIRELEVFGNIAYEYGVAHIFNAQGERVDQNEYMVLWKEDNGTWKIYRDFIKAGAPNPENSN